MRRLITTSGQKAADHRVAMTPYILAATKKPNSSINRKNIHRFGQIFSANQNRMANRPARIVARSISRPAARALTAENCWASSTDFMIVGRYSAGLEKTRITGTSTVSVHRNAIHRVSGTSAGAGFTGATPGGSSGKKG